MIRLAGCILLDADGRVLLLHRRTPARTQWELPGGKIEAGEDPSLAAAREVQEELGVLVAVTGELGSQDFEENGHSYHYQWFLASIISGQPQPLEGKFDEVRFFSWDELADRDDLSANTRNLVGAMSDGLLSQLQSRHRRTRNELLVESHNKRTKKLAERVLDNAAKVFLPIAFTCECSDASCGETVAIPVEAYTMSHQRADHFIVKPGHEQTDIERVVARYPESGDAEYCVVEKYLIGRRDPV